MGAIKIRRILVHVPSTGYNCQQQQFWTCIVDGRNYGSMVWNQLSHAPVFRKSEAVRFIETTCAHEFFHGVQYAIMR